MIQLLDEEKVLADLSQGEIAQLSKEVLFKKNAVLTSHRILFVTQCGRELGNKFFLLKDIRSSGFRQDINIVKIVIGFISAIIGMVLLLSAASQGMDWAFAALGFLFFALAFGLFISAQQNTFHITTHTDTFAFVVSKRFKRKRINFFNALVQRELDTHRRSSSPYLDS